MINFCITNEPKLVKGKWTNKKLFCKKEIKFGTPYATYYVYLYYDSGVEVIDLPRHVIVFCGILWQGKVTNFLKNVKQNGIFYAVVINKKSGEVKVINDFMDNFHLTYYVQAGQFVVTNQITAYSSKFKINQQWINCSKLGINVMDPPLKPNNELQFHHQVSFVGNVTPLEDVKYLGAGNVLELRPQDGQYECSESSFANPWFVNDHIGKLFLEKPQHDYQSALATAKQIISENCERIKEKYGNQLVHFCSTGVDSLTLQSYLDDVPMYGFCIEKFDQYHEPTELFKKLYHETSGTLHYFDIETLEDVFNSQLPKIQKTVEYLPAHMMFMHIKDTYKLNDRIIIQGNYGDDIFWHYRKPVIRHAVHRWGMKDARKIWNRCVPHYGFEGPAIPKSRYAKQPRLDEMNKYISNPCKDFATAMTALRYKNRAGAMEAQYMPNQLIIDPYMDLRLWSLLPSSDVQTQEASMLDAQLQKDMISSKLRPYLNSYTAGADMLYDSGFYNQKFKEKIINNLLKNLQAST